MEDVENTGKRTRRKKRSNGKRENEVKSKDFLSHESNNSNIESDASVGRILRNRSVNQLDNGVKKKRTRKQRKKKSLSEDTDGTVSPEKENKSSVSANCISSTDDSGSLNTSRKYDSPLLRLKRNISNSSPKKNEVYAEIKEDKESQSNELIQRKTKKRKLKKQNAMEISDGEDQHLINNSSDHAETNNKTPLSKPSKKKKSKKWIDATEHSFKGVDIDSNPNRETYQLEKTALNSLVFASSSSKSLQIKKSKETTEHSFKEVDIDSNSNRDTYQLENSALNSLVFSSSSSKSKKSKVWLDATEHSFKEADIDSNPNRETYQLEKSALNALDFSTLAKPRKKWSIVNTPGSTVFDTPSDLTSRSSVRLSTRAGTSSTPFVKKKSIMKVSSQFKTRSSIRKSTLKTKFEEISPTTINKAFQSVSNDFNVIDAEDVRKDGVEKRTETVETIGKMLTRKSNVADIVDNSVDVVEDDATVKRNYSFGKNLNSKTRKSNKVSFDTSDKEILDSTFLIDEEDEQLDNNEEKPQRRTYSFDGIEKTPLICHSSINNLETSNDFISNETLNRAEINRSNSKLNFKDVTDDSFVTKRNRNVSLKMTSPPWIADLSNSGDFPNMAIRNDERTNRRVSLSKKLSKPKLSPTAKLSTTLKASKVMKTPRFSGEKAQALLRMMNDSTNPRSETNCDKKLLGGRPSGTSTPRFVKKSNAGSIIKSLLDKSKKNVTFTESVSSPTVAKIKRSKMPNFSLIHQRQFERMESLSGYKERKEERAKLLLSGSKVPNCYSNTKNSSTLQKSVLDSSDALNNSRKVTCNKRLEFNKSQSVSLQYTSPNKSAQSSILQNKSPKKKVIANDKATEINEAGQNTSPRKGLNKSSALQNKTPKKEIVTNNKTPSKLNKNLFKVSQMTKVVPPKKPSTSNIPLVNKNFKSADQLKPNKSTETKISQKSKLPMNKNTAQEKLVENKNNFAAKRLDKNGLTKFGFKKSSKEELVALANKSRVPQANVQSRRTVVQGVRTNRRFELLMKMRKK